MSFVLHKIIVSIHKEQDHSESADLCQRWFNAQIHDLESQHGDSYHPKNLINFITAELSDSILKISSKSSHNLLSNDRISDWAVSMVIQIITKIKSLIPFATPDPNIKFHRNVHIFFSNVSNRQTNKRYRKHNLLVGDKYKARNKEDFMKERFRTLTITVAATVTAEHIYHGIILEYACLYLSR